MIAAETLPTPEERFSATRSAYEATVTAGFLSRRIPLAAEEGTVVGDRRQGQGPLLR